MLLLQLVCTVWECDLVRRLCDAASSSWTRERVSLKDERETEQGEKWTRGCDRLPLGIKTSSNLCCPLNPACIFGQSGLDLCPFRVRSDFLQRSIFIIYLLVELKGSPVYAYWYVCVLKRLKTIKSQRMIRCQLFSEKIIRWLFCIL